MQLQFHDTLSKGKAAFEPADPNRVTMYVCGPTVYSYAHIGNARPAVVFDVLFRLLRHVYGPDCVVYARNITDIDDKIIAAAKETGTPIDAITDKFARIYHEDMAALGVLRPTVEPHATAHVGDMIAMTQTLIDKGHAYEAEGHVLFAVASFADYGALSHRDREAMEAGARVEVAPYKRDPADFVLWKPAAEDEPGWDSPWGRGRPGWHIECSAMIEAHLGTGIDIHAGGQDLVFPHHENEIAQGCCAHDGARYAAFWLHNGFLNVDSEKMAKSLGNVLIVHDLLDQAPGEAIRYALLSAHYRAPLDWNDGLLSQARQALDRLYQALRRLEDIAVEPAPPAPVLEALADDLNTPKAFAALHEAIREANRAETKADKKVAKAALLGAGRLLGIGGQEPEAWFKGQGGKGGDTDKAATPEGIEALLAERQQARKAKDFARADAIRDQLTEAGVVIEDTPQGPQWRWAN